jgi:hypothetical protein
LIESCQFNFAKSLSEKPIMFFFFSTLNVTIKICKKKKKEKKRFSSTPRVHLTCSSTSLLQGREQFIQLEETIFEFIQKFKKI